MGTLKVDNYRVGTGATISSPSTNTLTLGTNNAERLRVTSDGSVGTGGLIPSGGNLAINSTIRSQNSSGNISYIGFTQYTGDTSVGSMFSYMGGDGRNTGFLNFSTNDTERMRINSDGNVNIGTDSSAPNSKLTVRAAAPEISLYSTPGNNTSALNMGDTDDYDIGRIAYNNNDNSMSFVANAGERFKILGDGQLYHYLYDRWYASNGTTTVGYIGRDSEMRVGGTDTDMSVTGVTNLSFVTNSTQKTKIDQYGQHLLFSTSGTSTIELRNQTASGSTHRLLYGLHSATNNTDGTPIYSIFTNGTVGTPSDLRLKKNVETARDGYLNDLKNLRVVKYNWKTQDDGDAKELGLIAQEVEAVFPGLIVTNNPGEDNEVKEIKNSVIPMMMLKALQEATARIETLEAEVAALKG